jgi:hypothetical protein
MKCFACNRRMLRSVVYAAVTSDGQEVKVGRDCAKKIIGSGMNGYQPPLGGPKLYGWEIREQVWKRERKESQGAN